MQLKCKTAMKTLEGSSCKVSAEYALLRACNHLDSWVLLEDLLDCSRARHAGNNKGKAEHQNRPSWEQIWNHKSEGCQIQVITLVEILLKIKCKWND